MRWWRGWAPLVLLPGAVFALVPPAWPRWAFMWTLAFAIYLGCKWLTWRRTPAPGAPAWKHLGYLLAWPGLDAAAFLKPGRAGTAPKPSPREWALAGLRTVVATVLLYVVAGRIPERHPYLVGWTGMVGLVLILHFGTFHLLSCAWRSAGVEARPLMNRPLASSGLSEFWGKRWNTAFRDLTHRFLFRPLVPRLGPRGAILAGFAFSGVVHDLVISVPAGGGYGGPSLFFLVQGAGILVERSAAGSAIGLGRGVRGWAFTMALLIGPVWALFHPPFVERIIVPFLRALGAIP